MAYSVQVNKTQREMYTDLENLMLANGWTKKGLGAIGSIKTSRGITYSSVDAVPSSGVYSDTTGIFLKYGGSGLVHTAYATNTSPSDTYYSDYPTEFSISFWIKFPTLLREYNNTSAKSIGYSAPFVQEFVNTTALRRGLSVNATLWGILGDYHGFYPITYLRKHYFNDKSGKSYENIVITVSNTSKTMSLYVNGVFVQTVSFYYPTYTYYPTFFKFASKEDLTFDQFVVWSKILNPAEVTAIYNKTSKVLSTDSDVFEIITENVGVMAGGTYSSLTDFNVPIEISISENSYNNILLRSFLFSSDYSVSIPDYRKVEYVGQEGTPKYLAGLAPDKLISKYWLVVDKNRVVIAYKIHDITANRTTPVYQMGYLGKVWSLGNDGNGILTAGTTTTNSYVWSTINTAFRSGLMYSTNNSYRLGYSGYISATPSSTYSTLVGLVSINSSVFVGGISLAYNSHYIGSPIGVYTVSSNQASPEDIITVAGIDYVVIPNVDDASYYLLLKLD